MRRHWRSVGKCILFLSVLCVCVRLVWQILTPKFFFDNTWPTTSTYTGFYQIKEDTIDVIFLGSSHAASFFIPQELYDVSGITSYNLSCEQQNLVTSYFWLKESLRFQKPKAVVLDCYMLFPSNPQEALNSDESCTRKAFDYMKWSPVKAEAVSTMCSLDEKQSLASYYFPNIRYHERWIRLSENDFSYKKMASHGELKGYAPMAEYSERENFAPFEINSAEKEEEMVPLMKEYLDNIVELCRQEDIRLVLVKTPDTAENIKRFIAIQNYADSHELPFYDFNEKDLYQKTEFDFRTDICDNNSHGSLWGAQKVTRQIGKILSEQYGLGGHHDSQWDMTEDYYKGIEKDCELIHITDIDTYTQALKDERYSIFISAKDECTENLEENVIENLKDLGLEAVMQKQYECSYYAVVSSGKILEQAGYTKLEIEGTIRDGRVSYELSSAGKECGNVSSIIIDGKEYSKGSRGLNFVVYNNDTKKIVDSVCFDTHEKGGEAVR